MLTFDIRKNQDYSCRQTVIVEVAKYMGANYEMIALGNWRFEYVTDRGNSIGEKVAQIYTTSYGENVMHFHGLELKSGIVNDKKYAKEMIRENLERGIPVIVHSDTFYCPWYIGYQIIHYSHFYIIIGSCNGKFQCYDPTMCATLKVAQEDVLLEGIDEFIIIEQCSKMNFSVQDYWSVLRNDVKTYINGAYEENMRRFCEDLIENFDPTIEFEPYRKYIDTAPLIDNIRDIFVFRIGYANMLKYLAEVTLTSEIKELADVMLDCSRDWRVIRGQFIKIALGRKYEKEKRREIETNIQNLCEKERNLAKKIMMISN